MIRAASLPVAILVVLAFDPVAFDYDAAKTLLLVGGAFLAAMLGGLGGTRTTAAIALFLATRIGMAARAPAPEWGALGAVAAAALLAHLPASRRALRRLGGPLLGGLGALLAAVAIVQALSGSPQAHATLANRNFAAAAIAMLAPWAWNTRLRWPALGLALLSVGATQSRGGALALAAALAWLLAKSVPRLRVPLLLGLPAAALALGLLLGPADTVKVRLHYARAALRLGSEAPLLGHGLGGFQREYPPIRSLEEHRISGGRTVHAVHNDLLESFAEGGALGLGAHLLLVVAAARAARRHPAQAASLLALLAASLVDLPMRDPALLAVGFVTLGAVSERRRRGSPLARAAALPLLLLLPPVFHHWRADREFARFLASGDAGRLDAALALEPDHREALLGRGRPEDLDRLVLLEPHHAGARYNRTRDLDRAEAVSRLREILRDHDPHHLLTRCRLAQLLRDEDPLAAEALLSGAIEADPRPWRPYALRAELRRGIGQYEAADHDLREAERRTGEAAVRRERLLLELARKDAPRAAAAAARVEPGDLLPLVDEAIRRGEEIEARDPSPALEPAPGEPAAEFAARIEKARRERRARLLERSLPAWREAALLAEALVARLPSPESYRRAARAFRGLDDLPRSLEFEGSACLLEGLEALVRRDDLAASRRFDRAFRACPALAKSPTARDALRLFLRGRPKALDDMPLSRSSLAPLLGE